MKRDKFNDKYPFLKDMSDRDIKHLGMFMMMAIMEVTLGEGNDGKLMQFISEIKSSLE